MAYRFQLQLKRLLTSLLLVVLFNTPSFTQTEGAITAKYIDGEITLDGNLDESVWSQAELLNDFWQYFPVDSLKSQSKTEVRILYNDETIFIGITAYSIAGDFVVSSLRRDFSGTQNDNVSLMFDTFSDGTNAFLFGVTPYGVQREVQVSEGGASSNGFNASWDIKWRAESQMYDDRYTVEVAIPFSSLKFKEGLDRWRFRAYRWDLQTNEQSTSARVPQQQLLSNLAFMNELKFERPLGKSKIPFYVIPYVNTLASKDFTKDASDADFGFGADAKVAVGNSMNLDLTVNPDFSNAEVDAIFTNLTRFEVFLPERRQFFIDNSDLFGNFGSGRDALPFFSRRIGLARDANGNLVENRIIAGARLSGKLNQNWRLGFLNIQTDEDISREIPSNNNSMIALQKKVFSRSNLGFFMVNRETFKDYEFVTEEEQYNRVVGLDFNLASADNVWSGKAYLHKSFQPNDSRGNLSSQVFINRQTRNWRLVTDFVYVDLDYRSDLGFIPRKDVFKNGLSISRTFYPTQGAINTSTFRVLSVNFWRPSLDMKHTDRDIRLSWSAAFKNQSTLDVSANNNFIFLANDFDPTRTEGAQPLPGNNDYDFNQFSVEYSSNPAKVLTYGTSLRYGEFFTGTQSSVGVNMSIRFQPWMLFSLDLNYDNISLPEPYASADYWLITPRFEVTFSKSIFWTTLFQYSNQRDNLGINSRLQWRFAPLSDLFLVYNDNYIPGDLSPKFRSINLKLTYWINL